MGCLMTEKNPFDGLFSEEGWRNFVRMLLEMNLESEDEAEEKHLHASKADGPDVPNQPSQDEIDASDQHE